MKKKEAITRSNCKSQVEILVEVLIVGPVVNLPVLQRIPTLHLSRALFARGLL